MAHAISDITPKTAAPMSTESAKVCTQSTRPIPTLTALAIGKAATDAAVIALNVSMAAKRDIKLFIFQCYPAAATAAGKN